MITFARHHTKYIKETIQFAKKIGLYNFTKRAEGTTEMVGVGDLRRNLNYLRWYADHEHLGRTRCEIYPDSPYGFGFTMHRKVDGDWKYWFNGGCLFHGSHDGFGSGSGPTFAVTLTPTNGWAIHT